MNWYMKGIPTKGVIWSESFSLIKQHMLISLKEVYQHVMTEYTLTKKAMGYLLKISKSWFQLF